MSEVKVEAGQAGKAGEPAQKQTEEPTRARQGSAQLHPGAGQAVAAAYTEEESKAQRELFLKLRPLMKENDRLQFAALEVQFAALEGVEDDEGDEEESNESPLQFEGGDGAEDDEAKKEAQLSVGEAQLSVEEAQRSIEEGQRSIEEGQRGLASGANEGQRGLASGSNASDSEVKEALTANVSAILDLILHTAAGHALLKRSPKTQQTIHEKLHEFMLEPHFAARGSVLHCELLALLALELMTASAQGQETVATMAATAEQCKAAEAKAGTKARAVAEQKAREATWAQQRRRKRAGDRARAAEQSKAKQSAGVEV